MAAGLWYLIGHFTRLLLVATLGMAAGLANIQATIEEFAPAVLGKGPFLSDVLRTTTKTNQRVRGRGLSLVWSLTNQKGIKYFVGGLLKNLAHEYQGAMVWRTFKQTPYYYSLYLNNPNNPRNRRLL